MIERTAVMSSNVASMGYDADHQVVEVEFKGGRVYHYLAVPPEVWESRNDEGSIGRWVAGTLKRNHEFEHGEFVPEEDEEGDDAEADA